MERKTALQHMHEQCAQKAERAFAEYAKAPAQPCNCIGPQNGQPMCPCSMRGVIVRDGRYIVPERDLGPAA